MKLTAKEYATVLLVVAILISAVWTTYHAVTHHQPLTCYVCSQAWGWKK